MGLWDWTGAAGLWMLRPVTTSTRYRIVVNGRLSESFASVFEGVTVEPLEGRTALEGEFADQAQLHGLLDRLRGLGIELVSINAIG
jgi:hypothetical protein